MGTVPQPAGGVLAEPWTVPAEALEEHTGPTLCYDDVLDFALWLDHADLVAAAAAGGHPPLGQIMSTEPETAA